MRFQESPPIAENVADEEALLVIYAAGLIPLDGQEALSRPHIVKGTDGVVREWAATFRQTDRVCPG